VHTGLLHSMNLVFRLTKGSTTRQQEVATAHKVAGMFGRRDPMRRYMDKIMAMIDEIGALPPGWPSLT